GGNGKNHVSEGGAEGSPKIGVAKDLPEIVKPHPFGRTDEIVVGKGEIKGKKHGPEGEAHHPGEPGSEKGIGGQIPLKRSFHPGSPLKFDSLQHRLNFGCHAKKTSFDAMPPGAASRRRSSLGQGFVSLFDKLFRRLARR